MRDFVVCSLLLRAGFSLAVLPFLLLFLPLAALKKLVGSLVSGKQVAVQGNKIEEQKGEYSHHQRSYPPQHHLSQLSLVGVVRCCAAEHYLRYEDDSVCEGGDNADEEVAVVAFAHAVVEPHAVVVEAVDAAVAGPAVLAAGTAVAIAELAVQHLAEIWGEADFLVLPGPLVVVHHTVGRVSQGRLGAGEHQCCQCAGEKQQQRQVEAERQQAGEVGGHGVGDEEEGGELCGRRRMREAVRGVLV